jgi:rRNA maturation RNase YbeY
VNSLSKSLEFKIKSIEISFISRSIIQNINKTHLNHNYSTDIITFDYSENKKLLEGEILISVDDALENSKKYNVSFKEEICRLIIHGFLHLLGYNDVKTAEKRKMKLMENQLLNRFKFILL